MNWDAIGALAEAIGAAGVVATLAYLAIQIQRSNRLAGAESNRFSQTASNPTILAIAQDPDLARVFNEGLTNRDSLTAIDRVRFDMLMGTLVGVLAGSIADQEVLGHRGDRLFSDQSENLRSFLLAPGGASWWAAYRLRYAPRVRADVEAILSGAAQSSTSSAGS